jgi:hypothetical protein
VISFTPSGTFLKTKLYQVQLVKKVGGEKLTVRDAASWVWISSTSGTFLAGDGNAIAAFQVYIANPTESPERDVADLRPIEFDWKIPGATFADGDSTRIFPGQSSTAPLSGAITLVRSGRYSIAYNIADRAADATTIVPTDVLYRIVDDAGNFGDLTLRILPQAASGDVAVLPGRDRAVADAGASTITVKLNEVITIARAVVDANGQPMDLSGFTDLQFVVQDARGLDLATVDHADITISGVNDDTYSFVCPIEMTSRLGVFDFSLNQVGGGQIVGGKWIVQRRAVAD